MNKARLDFLAARLDFLAARLDEDEAVAKAAAELSGDYWMQDSEECGYVIFDPGETEPFLYSVEHPQRAAHIARHDPARVLREVEAKRAILDSYKEQAGLDLPKDVAYGLVALLVVLGAPGGHQVIPAVYCGRCDVYYGPRSHNGRTGDPYCAECGMELTQVATILVKAEPGEGEQG